MPLYIVSISKYQRAILLEGNCHEIWWVKYILEQIFGIDFHAITVISFFAFMCFTRLDKSLLFLY